MSSQARWRHEDEHHFGVRPRAGSRIGDPHQPHARVWPGRLGDRGGLALALAAAIALISQTFQPSDERRVGGNLLRYAQVSIQRLSRGRVVGARDGKVKGDHEAADHAVLDAGFLRKARDVGQSQESRFLRVRLRDELEPAHMTGPGESIQSSHARAASSASGPRA